MTRETKTQAQERAMQAYLKTTSSLPLYACYCKHCDKKDTKLFTAQTFSRYYWKARDINVKSVEGKALVKWYKDNVKEGDIDLETACFKADGIYARRFGETELKKIYALGCFSSVEGNKLATDAKSKMKIVKDFIVSFDVPVKRKLHLMVAKDGCHIRYTDGYLLETYKNKRKFLVEDFRY